MLSNSSKTSLEHCSNNEDNNFHNLNENVKNMSDLSSYNIINNTQLLFYESGKEISDFSSNNNSNNNNIENKIIKDEIQSELDYISNLNSTLSSSQNYKSDSLFKHVNNDNEPYFLYSSSSNNNSNMNSLNYSSSYQSGNNKSNTFSNSIENFENIVLSKTIPSLFNQGDQALKKLRKKIQDPYSSSNTNNYNDKQSFKTMNSDSLSTENVSHFFDKKCKSATDNISYCINAIKNNYNYTPTLKDNDYTSYTSYNTNSYNYDNLDKTTSYSSTNTNSNTNTCNNSKYDSYTSSTITKRKPNYSYSYSNSNSSGSSYYDEKTDTNHSEIEVNSIKINISPKINKEYSSIIDIGSEFNFFSDDQNSKNIDNKNISQLEELINNKCNNNNNSSNSNTTVSYPNDNFSNSIRSLINEIDRLKTQFNNYNYNNSNNKEKYNNEKTLNRNNSYSIQNSLYDDTISKAFLKTNTCSNQSHSFITNEKRNNKNNENNNSDYNHYNMNNNYNNSYSNEFYIDQYNHDRHLYWDIESIESFSSEIERIYKELNLNSNSSSDNSFINNNNTNNNNNNNNNNNKAKIIKEKKQNNKKVNKGKNIINKNDKKSNKVYINDEKNKRKIMESIDKISLNDSSNSLLIKYDDSESDDFNKNNNYYVENKNSINIKNKNDSNDSDDLNDDNSIDSFNKNTRDNTKYNSYSDYIDYYKKSKKKNGIDYYPSDIYTNKIFNDSNTRECNNGNRNENKLSNKEKLNLNNRIINNSNDSDNESDGSSNYNENYNTVHNNEFSNNKNDIKRNNYIYDNEYISSRSSSENSSKFYNEIKDNYIYNDNSEEIFDEGILDKYYCLIGQNNNCRKSNRNSDMNGKINGNRDIKGIMINNDMKYENESKHHENINLNKNSNGISTSSSNKINNIISSYQILNKENCTTTIDKSNHSRSKSKKDKKKAYVSFSLSDNNSQNMIEQNTKLANKIKNMKQKEYIKEKNIQLTKELSYLKELISSKGSQNKNDNKRLFDNINDDINSSKLEDKTILSGKNNKLNSYNYNNGEFGNKSIDNYEINEKENDKDNQFVKTKSNGDKNDKKINNNNNDSEKSIRSKRNLKITNENSDVNNNQNKIKVYITDYDNVTNTSTTTTTTTTNNNNMNNHYHSSYINGNSSNASTGNFNVNSNEIKYLMNQYCVDNDENLDSREKSSNDNISIDNSNIFNNINNYNNNNSNNSNRSKEYYDYSSESNEKYYYENNNCCISNNDSDNLYQEYYHINNSINEKYNTENNNRRFIDISNHINYYYNDNNSKKIHHSNLSYNNKNQEILKGNINNNEDIVFQNNETNERYCHNKDDEQKQIPKNIYQNIKNCLCNCNCNCCCNNPNLIKNYIEETVKLDFNTLGNNINDIKNKYNNTVIDDITDTSFIQNCQDIFSGNGINNNDKSKCTKYCNKHKKLKNTRRNSLIKNKTIMNSINKKILPCMKNIPFIPASSKSSCKSYSLFANIQKVLSMIKYHNVTNCTMCKKKTCGKNNEIKKIIQPELFSKKESSNKSTFQSMCTWNEALLKLLHLYNKDVYNDLLDDVKTYKNNNEVEQKENTEIKILKLYKHLKKKSNEMLMIKYLIECLPSESNLEDLFNDDKNNNTNKNERKNNMRFNNFNNKKNTTPIKINKIATKISSSSLSKSEKLKWKRFNSNTQYRNKKNNNTYLTSTLELLKFSQKIQDFLSQEHYLRST
ncbi:hypothetical protein BCR32DRAFT_298969 [Anaeromyces robustus]|uniref:Uncharacterized protein n=1 Tax=Anaeromyces robustus TaxID=1754192 RepID=A0A1Y1X919_9FUNG|nr:hypothetical protein BCR32DRAFT_298969 [Anaeromyces robustus]|eukprot:ORX82198.1 hypothetical protein BCR32DRAFT_298969 [Anaeromyces robustus]